MRLAYTIEGTVDVPDGTVPVPNAENQFILPTGQLISVYPIIEMASGVDADDHANLTYPEASAIGAVMGDHDRTLYEVPDED